MIEVTSSCFFAELFSRNRRVLLRLRRLMKPQGFYGERFARKNSCGRITTVRSLAVKPQDSESVIIDKTTTAEKDADEREYLRRSDEAMVAKYKAIRESDTDEKTLARMLVWFREHEAECCRAAEARARNGGLTPIHRVIIRCMDDDLPKPESEMN
jgi:hypothetical protein